jgi:hypothetical protein
MTIDAQPGARRGNLALIEQRVGYAYLDDYTMSRPSGRWPWSPT